MVRICFPLALALSAFAASVSAPAADQARIASYCSPSGDVCYGIFHTRSGHSFRLTTAARYFSRYRICVRPLGQSATCHGFPVRRVGTLWGGTVRWERNFPVRGPRRYRVTWKLGSRRLGPSLSFTLPAPT